MNPTEIKYLTHTWNPLAMRCTPVSPACANCWHLRMANRLAANPLMSDEARAAYAGETGPVLIESRLGEPLKRKKSAVVGVQFMGDLFHRNVSDGYRQQIFKAMVKAPQHTFLVLTKRPHTMKMFFVNNTNIKRMLNLRHDDWAKLPIPNVWFGVTVENQAAADERRAAFEQVPAAVKFVSYEPALGAVNWSGWEFVNQIISGGETGPGARPSPRNCHADTLSFCLANQIAYHFKQHGEWLHFERRGLPGHGFYYAASGEQIAISDIIDRPHEIRGDLGVVKIGNKRAGHLLDGVEHREMPEVMK